MFAIASAFLPSPYALILVIISTTIGVFVGTIFYVRSFWENHVARIGWEVFSFLGSIAIIPMSRRFAGTAIERKTALSAESFSAAWDIVSLLYTIPWAFALTSIISLIAYSLVSLFSAMRKAIPIRLLMFIALIFMFTIPIVHYTEKALLLFLDDIIAFTFVRNCQATKEGSAQNCICESLPESAYIHFYEENNVVEARLRSELSSSSGNFSEEYDFSHVGDGESLGCVGIFMWQM